MNNKKDVILLGSTGSIGESSLRLLRKNKDKFNLIGVSAHNNVKLLSEIVNEFNVSNVVLSNPKNAKYYFGKTKLTVGSSSLIELAKINCDIVISGITGMSGLHPAYAAISVGKVNGEIVDDLDYEMDSNAEVDLNLVMNSSYEIIEIQGTGEKGTFSTIELNEMIDLGKKCIEKIFDEQEKIINNYD